MNNTLPLVSVVMSAFNGEVYLASAIESILKQTYDNFEFIILNNASTDRTKDIILSYKDPRLLFVDNTTNLGFTKSLNKGCRMATGKYIARLDADDIAHPERFEKQVDFLEKNPDISVLGTGYVLINSVGNKIKKVMLPDSEEKIFLKTLFASPVCHSSVLLKKSVLEQLNYYPENFPYYQDYALWINAMKYGYKICNLKDFLVYVRQHEKSATYKHFQDRHFPEIVELYKLIFKDILKLDISKKEVENLYKLYYMIDELEDEDLDNAITTLKRILNILVLTLRTSKLRIYTEFIFRICSCSKLYYKQKCHERNKCLLGYLRYLFLYYILAKKFLKLFSITTIISK